MGKRTRIALLVAAAVVVALAIAFLPVRTWAASLAGWSRDAGPLGAVAFALAYATAVLLFLPGWPFTAAAGLAYGPWVGVAVAAPAALLGAGLSFAAGRTIARGPVARAVARRPALAAVESAIAGQGFRTVLLLRLSPLFPFTLLNYALGVTRVRARDYLLATAIGILPGSLLYTYIGSVVGSAAALASGARPDAGPAGRVLFWVGLGATLLVTTLVTRAARRALARTIPLDASTAPTPQDSTT